jgi:hypothetical protein
MAGREGESMLLERGEHLYIFDRGLNCRGARRRIYCHAIQPREIDHHSTVAQRCTNPAMATRAQGDA